MAYPEIIHAHAPLGGCRSCAPLPQERRCARSATIAARARSTVMRALVCCTTAVPRGGIRDSR
jgi:hypothetical protein